MKVVDLFAEAFASLADKPIRTVMTALGTVFGIAALIGIAGLTTTAEQQVSDQFDVLLATEVLGTFIGEADIEGVERRLEAQDSVTAAGVFRTGNLADVARTVEVGEDLVANVNLVEASPGFFQAREVELLSGRWFDWGHWHRGEAVAVIGSRLGAQLGAVGATTTPRSIWIDGVRHSVVGVAGESPRMASVLNSVVVPIKYEPTNSSTVTSFTVLADLGEASRVADALAQAAFPGEPGRATIVRPPEPGNYVEEIREDIQALVIGSSAIALLVGVLAIGNATSVSVVERRSELGLRLALGAKRRDLIGQVVLESALIGLWGGILGTALGILAVVVGSMANEWNPIVPLQILIASPFLGMAIGALAGLFPAYRTSRIQPDRALRTE